MENETPGSKDAHRKMKAFALRVWTWQPAIMRRHTSFQGVLPVAVWLAFGFVLYIPASKVLPALIYNWLSRVPVSPIPIAVAVKTSPAPSNPEELYLDLLKKTLTRAQTAPCSSKP